MSSSSNFSGSSAEGPLAEGPLAANALPAQAFGKRASWSFIPESVAWCALALVFVLSFWKPSDSAVAIGFGDSIWHIGLSLLGFLSAAIFAGSLGRFGSSQRLSLLWLLIALVVLWHAMVTGYSIGRTNVKNSIYGFWQSTSMWLLLPTIAWLVRSPKAAARLLKLWWVLAVFVLMWGFWEYGVLQPAQRGELAKDRIGYLQKSQIDPDSSSAVLIVNRIESTEVLSVFALANSYAGFLVALWPLWLGWMLQGLRERSELFGSIPDSTDKLSKISQRAQWFIPLVLVLATALALLLTKSRTAWVAAGVSTVLALLLDPVLRADLRRWMTNQPMLVAAAVVSVLVIFGGVYALDPLIFQEAGKSLAYRMDYWKGAWELIGQQPLYGFGSLNFQSTYLQVKKITAAETPADPHNFLFELAHIGGWGLLGLTVLLLGALSFCGLRKRIIGEGLSGDPFARSSDGFKGPLEFALWGTVILSAVLIFVYAFFTAGDLELFGTAIAIAIAAVFGYWLHKDHASASVQSLVANQPGLLLVSFLGVLVHFLASGGWMFPGTMIAPMVAMGLWIAGAGWIEPTEAAAKPSRLAGLQGPLIAAVLIGLWGWSMAWPYFQTHRITGTFARDSQGKLQIDSVIADKRLPSSDEYAAWIASVPYDPDLAKWGMEFSATVLDSKLPVTEKISWLHQFQEACKLLIERDPKNASAYAEAASQSLRASIGQMLDPSLNDELAARRTPQGAGPGVRGPAASGGARGAGGRASGGRASGARSVATQLIQDSFRYYQEATKYAPASAELHLQTAVVAAMQSNWKVCEQMLDEAEKIDSQTPHRDRKIEAAKVWVPREMVPVIEERAVAGKKISEEGNPDWDQLKELIARSDSVPGEPVRRTLRSFFKNP